MQRIQSAMHIDGQLELIHEEILASLLALHNRAKFADLPPTILRNVQRMDLRVLLLKVYLNWQSNGDFSIVGLFLNFS